MICDWVTNSALRKHHSRIFDILSVINVDERNRELQLMCRESID